MSLPYSWSTQYPNPRRPGQDTSHTLVYHRMVYCVIQGVGPSSPTNLQRVKKKLPLQPLQLLNTPPEPETTLVKTPPTRWSKKVCVILKIFNLTYHCNVFLILSDFLILTNSQCVCSLTHGSPLHWRAQNAPYSVRPGEVIVLRRDTNWKYSHVQKG